MLLTIDILVFLLRTLLFLLLCKLIPLFLLLIQLVKFLSFLGENFLMDTDCKAGNAA